jgi:hypothetical protein
MNIYRKFESENMICMDETGEMRFPGVFSEREEAPEDTETCMVYLENGRYKNSFEFIQILGKGGFGICTKVLHKLDSNAYAIKKIRMHLALN